MPVVHYIRYKIEWGGWDEMRWDEIFSGLGNNNDEDGDFECNSGRGFEWWLVGGGLKISIMILYGGFFVERNSRVETREVMGPTQMRVCAIWYHGHGHSYKLFSPTLRFSLLPMTNSNIFVPQTANWPGNTKNPNKSQHQTSGMLKSSCTYLMIWSH